jgi:hypothetical protein
MPFFRFIAFYFGAIGIGSAISVVWVGMPAMSWVLLGGSNAAACWLGLAKLKSSYLRIEPITEKQANLGNASANEEDSQRPPAADQPDD